MFTVHKRCIDTLTSIEEGFAKSMPMILVANGMELQQCFFLVLWAHFSTVTRCQCLYEHFILVEKL